MLGICGWTLRLYGVSLLRASYRRLKRSWKATRASTRKLATQAVYHLPFVSRYDPRKKIAAFRDRCRRVSSFPTDSPCAGDDWYFPIRPPEIIHRELSSGLDLNQTEKFRDAVARYQHGCDFVIPEVFLSCIHEAKIFSKDLLVLSGTDDIFLESALGLNEVLESSAIMETLIRPRLRSFSGKYCLLASPWSGTNYYHWMLDALPRLATIQQFAELRNTQLIVPHELKAFHRQSLQIAGIPTERLVRFDGSYWQLDRLYYPSLLSETGNPSPHAVAWLRSTFLRGLDPRRARRLLYVSRRDARNRKVLNEEEILEYLITRGFECVCLESMPLADQVKAFSEARIVIGPHGAGFTNIVFAPEGSMLIEFFGESYVNGCFWALTNICGQNHTFIVAPTETLDYDVPLEQLRVLLDRVI